VRLSIALGLLRDCTLIQRNPLSPTKPVFYGAQALTLRPDYLSTFPITRQEYMENGSERCRRRFISTGLIPDIGNENVVLRRTHAEGNNNEEEARARSKRMGGGHKGKKRRLFGAADSDDALSGEEEVDVRIPAFKT
jgi:hypothetical protein